jgi:hypothetical protein
MATPSYRFPGHAMKPQDWAPKEQRDYDKILPPLKTMRFRTRGLESAYSSLFGERRNFDDSSNTQKIIKGGIWMRLSARSASPSLGGPSR